MRLDETPKVFCSVEDGKCDLPRGRDVCTKRNVESLPTGTAHCALCGTRELCVRSRCRAVHHKGRWRQWTAAGRTRRAPWVCSAMKLSRFLCARSRRSSRRRRAIHTTHAGFPCSSVRAGVDRCTKVQDIKDLRNTCCWRVFLQHHDK